LDRIKDDVLVVGSKVQDALGCSVASLKRRDLEASRRIIAADRHINAKRIAIEADVLAPIATQQPVAGDMRFLAAALEIVTELERIGDYAKGIAKINLLMGEEPQSKPLVDLPLMADKVGEMLHRALEAYISHDVELAGHSCGRRRRRLSLSEDRS
jgi:phosphate transport system protein